jgi:hypothetical protein
MPAVLAQPALAARQQAPRIRQADIAADLTLLAVQRLVTHNSTREQRPVVPVRVDGKVPAELPVP